jgi:hypothetical protein
LRDDLGTLPCWTIITPLLTSSRKSDELIWFRALMRGEPKEQKKRRKR